MARFFEADPEKSLARVLQANHERMRQAGVTLAHGQMAMAAADGATAPITMAATETGLPAGTCCQITPADLDQVLDNVVANATQAMQNTKVKHLRITQKLVDGMVLIDVSDTGCGIAPADQARALNTHYTTKSTGGTGLPASRNILRRYSGHLMILHSEPGVGTTVRIATIAS